MKSRWLVLVVLCLPLYAHASEVFLVRLPSEAPALTIETLGSRYPVEAANTDISRKLTFVVYMDGISPERWDRVKTAISALRAARTEPFELLILQGGATQAMRWDTPARFARQLETFVPSPTPVESQWTEAGNILASLPGGTENWESVVLISEPRLLEVSALSSYFETVASDALRARRIRFFFWGVTDDLATAMEPTTAPDTDRQTIWSSAATATCGGILPSSDSPPLWIDRLEATGCRQISFQPLSIPSGFLPYAASLTPATGLPSLHGILTGPSSQPASLEKYSELLRLSEEAQSAYTDKRLEDSLIALQAALGINPFHLPMLRLGGDVYAQQKNWAASLQLLEPLTILYPRDGELFRKLGDVSYELKDWARSEKNYTTALELRGDDRTILEKLSVIREQAGDLDGASSYLARLTRLDPANVALHLRQGKILDRQERRKEAASSYEAALNIEPGLDDVRIHLIEFYRVDGNTARVTELLNARIPTVGNDLPIRMKYAALAEGNGLPESALKFYSLAIDTDREHEPAHYGRASLLFASGNLKETYDAVETGLKSSPSSARLHLIKIDALDREQRVFEMKDAIRIAAAIEPQEEPVLQRLARVSDVFGDHAGEAYQRWTEALIKSAASEPTLKEALKRGVVVALRDGDSERALAMSRRLEDIGDSQFTGVGAKPALGSSTVQVSGGIKGLAAAAQLDPSTPAARLVAEYARTLLRKKIQDDAERKLSEDRLKRYFEIVRALRGFGQAVNGGSEIRLDLNSNTATTRAESVLELLGWQIGKSPRGEIRVEVRSGAENGLRQELVSVLGIDEAGMKLGLEQTKTFTFKIMDEQVPVVFEESFLLDIVHGDPRTRGLVEEMLYNAPLARLYVGLSSMNQATRGVVVHNVEPEQLLKRAPALSFYGASIAIEDGGVVLPGGRNANAAWAALVGANPDTIGQFLGNLIKKDGGKLLAYFHTIAGLPPIHQRFFTRTQSRLTAFYKAFPFLDERPLDAGVFVRREDPFVRLSRELPLDPDGNVKFPGSERVWMVARGESASIADVQKLARRVGQITSPDQEDEILLDMLKRTNDVVRGGKASQIENFLSVARIDSHRREPMDEVMALTLSQGYARYQSIFPYFAELPDLTAQQAGAFFQAAARLEGFSGVELNTVLGEFHSLLKLVVLLSEVRAIPDRKAAELFTAVCEGFGRIQAYRDVPAVSFELLERTLRDAGAGIDESADDLLIRHFAGSSPARTFLFEGVVKSVNLADANAARMRAVLQLQSISSLDALLRIYRAALALTKGTAGDFVSPIEVHSKKLIELKPAPNEKLSGDMAEQLFIARPEKVSRILLELKKELGKKKPSPKNTAKLANEIIGELNPFLKTTLTGWIYAYYSSPRDLAVASNRYLVRSHVFYEAASRELWPETRTGHGDSGSYLIGSFAQMARGIGVIATSQVESSETFAQTTVISTELAAVRSVPWTQVAERSTHMVALKIKLGREFVVNAAFDRELRRDLENATIGVLGLARRFDLFDSLASFDTTRALRLLSASDLFLLADTFAKTQENTKVSSAVSSAYNVERQRGSPGQADYFGGFHAVTNGCVHPHITNLGPYEDYADLLRAEPVAERLSDILLEIAESADRAALPAEALGLLAEDLVREFAKKAGSIPKEDWITAMGVMHSIDVASLVPLLEKK